MTEPHGTSPDAALLAQRLTELEAENAFLRSAAGTTGSSSGFHWRSAGAALLIVLASVLVPVSVVTGWTKAVLVDEATFVSALAPLSDDPVVQAEIIRHTSEALQDQLQLDQLVESTFDGLTTLDLPADTKVALNLLRGPTTQGVRSLTTDTVTAVVESETFGSTWNSVLRGSHRALAAAAGGSMAGGAVLIDTQGGIILDLDPVVAAVKSAMLTNGISVAEQIPSMDLQVTLARSEALAYAGPIYRLAVTAGLVIPLVTLLLFLCGIAAARTPRTAVIGSGIGLVIGAGSTLILLEVAELALITKTSPLGVTPAALAATFSQVVSEMRNTSTSLIVIASLLIVLAWLTGSSNVAAAVRGNIEAVNQHLAHSLTAKGFRPGHPGMLARRHSRLARILLACLVILALVLLPTRLGSVAMVTLIALALWWVMVILEKTAGRTEWG